MSPAAAPCPACGRPMQAGRPTCLYCGAGAGAAPPPPPSPVPERIASADDLADLLKAAMNLAGAGRMPDCMRLLERLYAEVSPEDIKALFDMALPEWTKSMKGTPDVASFMRATAIFAMASHDVGAGKYAEAADKVVPAMRPFAGDQRQHPLLPLLVVGLHQAGNAQARDARYSALVKEGTELMVQPGRMEEGLRKLKEALALLPDPPTNERDRVRRERIEGMLSAMAKGAVPPPPAPEPKRSGAPHLFEKGGSDISGSGWG